MNNQSSLVESTLVPHSAFEKAKARIETAFKYASNQSEALGIAIVGESGTGKSSLLDVCEAAHPKHREADGMHVPILRVSVPPGPTIKSLAAVMLDALEEPLSDRGTENERTKQLRVKMRNTGVVMVMLDEFQHFYDKNKRRFMYHAADWLKMLIDQVRCTLVVAGLPDCMGVVEHNEQLQRRFLAPVHMPRFNWNETEHRHEFAAILGAFHEKLSTKFDLPELDSKEMAFRFYCATGELISLVSKILWQAERNASCACTKAITLEVLDEAHMESVWISEPSEMLRPFRVSFDSVASVDVINRAKAIQVHTTQESLATPIKARFSQQKIHSLLSKKRQ